MHPKVLSSESWTIVRRLVDSGCLEGWTLAGGTGLAMQLGHRYSEDLDFFRTDPFDTERLMAQLSGIGKIRIQSRADNTLHAFLDSLRVSFLKSESPFLFPTTQYRGLTIADPRDIAVLKIIAIGGRGSRKDFVDLYFLLQSGTSLENILDWVHKRYTRVDYNSYHLLKSLVYFDDAESEPMPEMIRKVKWPQVRDAIIAAVRGIPVVS